MFMLLLSLLYWIRWVCLPFFLLNLSKAMRLAGLFQLTLALLPWNSQNSQSLMWNLFSIVMFFLCVWCWWSILDKYSTTLKYSMGYFISLWKLNCKFPKGSHCFLFCLFPRQWTLSWSKLSRRISTLKN
jgi:hypothetical protein